MYSHSHGSSPLPLSPLSADLTVKRLDFENIRIATATATSPRTQVLNIRRSSPSSSSFTVVISSSFYIIMSVFSQGLKRII